MTIPMVMDTGESGIVGTDLYWVFRSFEIA